MKPCHMLLETDLAEAENQLLMKEEDYKRISTEGDVLDMQKIDTLEKLQDAEENKSKLDKSIIDNNSRIMQIETEMQKLRAHLQAQEAEIKDLMWRKGRSSSPESARKVQTKMHIIPVTEKYIKRADDVKRTSYYSLVADDILDSCER